MSWLCQMSGVPAAGKSTVVEMISRETGAVAVDLDVIKSALLPSFDTQTDHRRVGAMAYDVVFALADYYLGQGRAVVIDTPCAYEALLVRGMEIASRHGAGYKYVECVLNSLEELNRRRTTRPAMASQVLTRAVSREEYQAELARTVRPRSCQTLTLDTMRPSDENKAALLEYLGN